jgi:hypothetical protein
MMFTRVLIVALGLVAGAACKKKIDGDKAEKVIGDELAARGLPVTITCPDGRTPKAGDVFTCDAVDKAGAKITITVTQKDDQGNVEWKVDGMLVDTEAIIADIKTKAPDAVVTCDRKVIVLKSGDTASCKVEGGGETARLEITQNGESTGWKIVAATP